MLFSLALAPAEKILNSFLKLDPETEKRLMPLAGKVIAIEVSPFGTKIFWLFTKDGVHLLDSYEGIVDVTLRGSTFSFLRMTKESDSAAVFASDITVMGDAEVSQEFKQLFANLNIDWEEQLSHLTGDVIAHQIGNILRQISNWSKESISTFRQDLSEYLHEEARYFPSREEVQEFFSHVDKIHNDTERLEARINLLEKKFSLKDSTSAEDTKRMSH